MTAQQIEWDQQLVEKYSGSGPRYTSYPTAPEFSETFRAADFEQAATRYPHRPLSLFTCISRSATNCVTSAAAIK